MFFCPCLSNLHWTHMHFPVPFRWQSKVSLPSFPHAVDGEGRPSTPICRVYSILKGFMS